MTNNSSFLGTGWAFPPAFIKRSPTVVELSSEEDNIQENLKILFATRTGERLMEFGYGTKLQALAFGSIDASLAGNIKDTVRRSVLLYEPRITIEDIVLDLSESKQGIVLIQVEYRVKQTNSRNNFVHPFHLTEGTNLDL